MDGFGAVSFAWKIFLMELGKGEKETAGTAEWQAFRHLWNPASACLPAHSMHLELW